MCLLQVSWAMGRYLSCYWGVFSGLWHQEEESLMTACFAMGNCQIQVSDPMILYDSIPCWRYSMTRGLVAEHLVSFLLLLQSRQCLLMLFKCRSCCYVLSWDLGHQYDWVDCSVLEGLFSLPLASQWKTCSSSQCIINLIFDNKIIFCIGWGVFFN